MLGNSITNAFLSKLINDHDIELRKESYGQDDVTTNRSRQVWLKSEKVELANGSVIKLCSIKNGTSIRCPVHKDNRYAAFAGFNDKSKMYVRCPVCRKVWWIESDGPTYDFDDFEKVLSSRKRGGAFSLNAIINKIEFQSERYLKIDKLTNGLTFIKSPKGTGKTHFLEREVKRYGERYGSLEEYEAATDDEEKQVHANRSVLLIGHRRALIKNICTRLGLNCYLDDKTKPDGRERREQEIYARKKRYGVCLDSISKVRDHHYDMVVIDESEQVLQHFLSETIGSKRTKCFDIFSEILRNASRVILLDADLGWTTYNTIRSIYSPKQQSQTKPKTTPSATFYVNRWASENRSICIHSKQEYLEERLIVDIVDGKRVFVTSNSRGLISALDQKLDKLKKADKSNIVKIVITSKNSKTKKSQQFINDIASEILKYQVILCSPSLGTGVDITFDGKAKEIDAVYGFFKTKINSHFDIDQQLARVRHPKCVNVWIAPAKYDFEIDNAVTRSDAAEKHSIDVGAPILDMAGEIISLQRSSKNDLKTNFINYKMDQNWKIKLMK